MKDFIVIASDGQTFDNKGFEVENDQVLDYIEAQNIREAEFIAEKNIKNGEYGEFKDFSVVQKGEITNHNTDKKMLVMNASGKMINPFDLEDSDFDPKIIAKTLSRICRFWGQTSQFYSVAQHCIAISKVFEKRKLKQWALLHEVFEGLTGMDIPTPVKHSEVMLDYREAEEKALLRAAKIFGLNPCIPDEIKTADKRMLVTEALQYMNTQNYDWTKIAKPYKEKHILDIVKNPMSMEVAEAAFLFHWGELFSESK